jgi:ATP-binding cassette subfamily B protein
MLGFYNPNKGEIFINETPVKNIHPRLWRQRCGAVMQEGFIFSDTIANNIAVGVDSIDKERLLHAVTVANIRDFIDGLPLGYNTKIGMEGKGISQGQRQCTGRRRGLHGYSDVRIRSDRQGDASGCPFGKGKSRSEG